MSPVRMEVEWTMSHDAAPRGTRWRQEVRRFLVTFAWLFAVLAVFTLYRDLLLRSEGLAVVRYGFALVTALTGAKVILLVEPTRLGRRYEGAPLLLSVVYKTSIFYLVLLFFSGCEKGVEGLLRHVGFWGGISDTLHGLGLWEVLARNLAVGVALVPYFATRELARLLGEGKLRSLFLDARPEQPQPASEKQPTPL